MASTTFTGPVRSLNGFQDVSVNSTTGAVTTNATFGAATTVATLTATTGITGAVTGTVTLPTYTVTTANALSTKPAGMLIYVSNGLAGAPCVAVGNGTNWISPAGTAIAAS